MIDTKSIPPCGIDFGTTNSSVAIFQNHHPIALPIDPLSSNPQILKSLIFIDPNHQATTGSNAIQKYLYDLENIPSVPPRIVDTGRLIKTFGPSTGGGVGPPIWVPEIIEVDDSGRGRLLQSLKSALTNSSFTGTNIFGKFYSVEELLTILLSELKHRAEISLNHSLDSAVIGRPIRYVGQGQDQIALNRMAQIARNSGFKNIKFEYEPVGAALNYGLDIKKPQTILVFDFGGGTLDICIMKFPEKEILAVSGRPIGGDLLNSRLINTNLLPYFGSQAIISSRLPFPRHFFHSFSSWYQTTLLKTTRNIGTLQELAIRSNQPETIQNFINFIINDYGFNFFQSVDQTKIDLSSKLETQFSFNKSQLQINQNITRQNFEQSINKELIESQKCITESLKTANLTAKDIDKVILTGGSSQIPCFISLIHQFFSPEIIIDSNHFTAVALGLSIRAAEIFS